jgi:type IV pilus assembly protein PilY1
MNTSFRVSRSFSFHNALRWRTAACAVLAGLALQSAHAGVALADQPVFTNTGVPGNLALALSVEFPTAVSVAHIDTNYDGTKVFLGYFDPAKCYGYSYNNTEALRHFFPAGLATATHTCANSNWSGNFLNWATMQTVDPFRWALTGGYRSRDTATETYIEKAWASGQGGSGNFPNKSLGTSNLVSDNTGVGWSTLNMRVWGLGNKMRFTRTGDLDSTPRDYNPASAMDQSKVYEVSVRVKVCDDSVGAGPLESNCTAYPAGNYKPTGLLQQYSDKIRYSAFGYLNDDNLLRDGGVLRARQKFVGPNSPRPNATPATNAATEWDANNGVMSLNPDALDASDTATLFGVPVTNSGVMNYLNKFGQITPGSYKTYDPVSELYYAALRYFKNLGNVPEWTSMDGASTSTKTTWVDGFPVITNWDDPIQYACQRNFILGIGDVNTHADKNVPGTSGSTNEPTKPAALALDPVDAVTATNKVGQLHGLGGSLGSTENYGGCCNNNSALMAGLAYDSNTKDIRPDIAAKPQTKGMQTVQTYWLDILEYRTYKANNQFYLAAKYGGFKVPAGFDPYAQTADIPEALWTSGEMANGQKRPNNYFVASQPDQMVSGLKRAFSDIAGQLRVFTTSFSTALPQVASTGNASYSAQYDSASWTAEISGNKANFNSSGEPELTPVWSANAKLQTLVAGTGWDTQRTVVSYNNSGNAGVPFRLSNLSASQQLALDTAYRTGNDAADFLNYVRGDASNEESSTTSTASTKYRNRLRPLGDVVGSRARAVVGPSAPYSGAANPGYNTFRVNYKDRLPMVYVGSNDGMLHAFNGSINAGGDGGTEVFAYVPGAVIAGPTGSPAANGLQTRGDPDFTHRFFVDGTPATFDIDFGRTQGGSGTDWRTILVGSLGKGGKSYYALDITDPTALNAVATGSARETAVAAKVLWEFKDTDLGFTFGEPIAVKLRKYGWVLVFGSGYNNTDGKGYIFIVNPRTGGLLEKIVTGPAAAGVEDAGLAHVQAFVLDRTDGTADTLYAGDLSGNLWRVDVGDASASYAAFKLATLSNAAGDLLPVTSRPLVVVQPGNNRRWITVGTGRLLNNADVSGGGVSQAFFAIMDGNNLRPNSAAQLPSGMSFPLGRNKLKELTDLTKKITLDLSSEIGWWFDLGKDAGLGWRVLNDPTSFYGAVTFSSMLPSVSDACNPSGQSRVYSIDLGTGKTKLLSNGQPLAYSTAVSGVITDLRHFNVQGEGAGGTGAGAGGEERLIACGDTGGCKRIENEKPAAQGLRRLNWRELQLAD